MADTQTQDGTTDLGLLINQAGGGKGGNIGAMQGIMKAELAVEQQKDKDPALNKLRDQASTRLQADQKLMDDAYAGIEPLGERLKPWDAKKEAAEHTTDPFQAFGSAGSIFALLASAFTHTPAINAMNGMAAAINSVRANDQKAYDTAYDAWKTNTQLALDRHRAQHEDYQDALERAKTDPQLMAQEMQVLSAKYGDKIAALQTQMGNFEHLESVINARQNSALAWAEAKPRIEAEHEKAVLAFGYDQEWADSKAGSDFFNSEAGKQWRKQNPNKVAPDQVHALNFMHAQQVAAQATNPYGGMRLSGLDQFLAKKTAEAGGTDKVKADDLKSWTAEFNKETTAKSKSPIAMYIDAAEKDAKEAGQPWGQPQIAEAVQRFGRDSKGSLTDKGAKFVVDQYLSGDRQAIVGFARNPADKEKLTNMIAEEADKRNIKPEMLAVMSAEFQGLLTGERALGTRTAQLGLAAGELQSFIPQALEASKRVDRTNFPSANYALQAYENQTGDPELRAFGAALNAVENAYSQIISRGAVATDADKRTARDLISTIDSPEVLQAVMDQIMKETQGAARAPGIVREEYMKGFLLTRGEQPAESQPAQPDWNGFTIKPKQ